MAKRERLPDPKLAEAAAEPVAPAVAPTGISSFPIVGVGASAGGLEAFTELLKALPPDTGMAFVLVQHLDPVHESALVQILGRVTSLPVIEITNDLLVRPNCVHVIPPDTSLRIAQGVLKLEPRPRKSAPHRPIDAFFESLAQDQRERAIGVVLSGTGSDGATGLEEIKAEGGITFAQDDSAKYDSMPRSAVAAGAADFVFSPRDIAAELVRIARHPYVADGAPRSATIEEDARAEATAHADDPSPLPSGGRPPGSQAPTGRGDLEEPGASEPTDGRKDGDDGYKRILLLLRSHSGVDFTLYKSTSIQRRINRRMILTKHDTLADYARFLHGNSQELDALYSDVLISVTSFFRNPEAFDALQRDVMPKLLNQRSDDPVRCWVLGCSTGQEAYSVAIAFVEAAERAQRMRKVQVFATDLNEKLLEKARHGLYSKSLATDVSPERLRRFFVEQDGGYQITKALRDMVVFARQNLIADPPFSRIDLISCRNLLIYLEPTLQKRALPTFHYALKPGGFLLLGASESIGGFADLFEPVDKKHKIYVKKSALTPALHLPITKARGGLPPLPLRPPTVSEPMHGLRSEVDSQREADRIAIDRYAPPRVLVNSALQVLQFRGPTGAYLEPPAGKATFDVLKMAREGLMLPLRAAIDQARKDGKLARSENVRVRRDGETRTIDLEVIPLTNAEERGFLIVFKEAGATDHVAVRERTATPPLGKAEEASRVAELEAELADTREYLQSTKEQHEAATEELQASNEEVQSANEELQSVNEELETSKEELESANEELTTLNEEVSNRNVELNRLNNDLVNLQASAKLPIVLLGRDLTVCRFSPQAEKLFDLLATDVGRPIGHVRHNLVAVDATASPLDLESLLAEVIASVRDHEREVRHKSGRCYSLRVRPYLTLDGKIDGAVLVLIDIDDLKQAEKVVAAARDYAENTVATVRGPLLMLDKDLRVESANPAFYRTFQVTPAETIGRVIFELGNRQWNIPKLRELLERVVPERTTIEEFQIEHEFETIGARVMLLNARQLHDPRRKSPRVLLAIEDITLRHRAESALQQQYEQVQSHVDELRRFNDAAVERELRMIDLKKEVNELCRRHGEAARYPLEFEREGGDANG